MNCKWCNSVCTKNGKQKDGTQRFCCKKCRKSQQLIYKYNAYKPETHRLFRKFRPLGVPDRQLATFLEISLNTVKKWISRAKNIEPAHDFPPCGTYDIDEAQTYLIYKKNEIWITYGWNVDLKKPIGLHVGRRRKTDLEKVVDQVLQQQPSRINTDRLSTYKSLIPKEIHKAGKRKANHIERQHLNLRKDIVALTRKTICSAKKIEMLEARIKWYFWGETEPDFFLKNTLN